MSQDMRSAAPTPGGAQEGIGEEYGATWLRATGFYVDAKRKAIADGCKALAEFDDATERQLAERKKMRAELVLHIERDAFREATAPKNTPLKRGPPGSASGEGVPPRKIMKAEPTGSQPVATPASRGLAAPAAADCRDSITSLSYLKPENTEFYVLEGSESHIAQRMKNRLHLSRNAIGRELPGASWHADNIIFFFGDDETVYVADGENGDTFLGYVRITTSQSRVAGNYPCRRLDGFSVERVKTLAKPYDTRDGLPMIRHVPGGFQTSFQAGFSLLFELVTRD